MMKIRCSKIKRNIINIIKILTLIFIIFKGNISSAKTKEDCQNQAFWEGTLLDCYRTNNLVWDESMTDLFRDYQLYDLGELKTVNSWNSQTRESKIEYKYQRKCGDEFVGGEKHKPQCCSYRKDVCNCHTGTKDGLTGFLNNIMSIITQASNRCYHHHLPSFDSYKCIEASGCGLSPEEIQNLKSKILGFPLKR